MLDVMKIRQDFPMLNGTKMHGQPLIYFDNGATTLKPQCVIDAVCDYLTNYSGNAHRGDYDLSHDVDTQFEKTRKLVAQLINCDHNDVVYTYGSTDSLNLGPMAMTRSYFTPASICSRSRSVTRAFLP